MSGDTQSHDHGPTQADLPGDGSQIRHTGEVKDNVGNAGDCKNHCAQDGLIGGQTGERLKPAVNCFCGSLPGWLAAAKDERIARAVAAIHSDTARNLTNAELADLAGMSVSTFSDRFKEVLGQGPGAYLRAWRLDQAAEALVHSSTPIDAIADRVGYTSKEAFNRAFQAKFDQSPSSWRRSRQR